jgi:hypothetical protein
MMFVSTSRPLPAGPHRCLSCAETPPTTSRIFRAGSDRCLGGRETAVTASRICGGAEEGSGVTRGRWYRLVGGRGEGGRDAVTGLGAVGRESMAPRVSSGWRLRGAGATRGRARPWSRRPAGGCSPHPTGRRLPRAPRAAVSRCARSRVRPLVSGGSAGQGKPAAAPSDNTTRGSVVRICGRTSTPCGRAGLVPGPAIPARPAVRGPPADRRVRPRHQTGRPSRARTGWGGGQRMPRRARGSTSSRSS